MQTQQPKKRGNWRRRREKYLRESGRHLEVIKEGYECEDSSKDWAVIAGRGERIALERHDPGARLFVVRRDPNLAQAGAKVSHVGANGSAEDTDAHCNPRPEGGRLTL